MYKQSKNSGMIILPPSEVMPSDEAKQKAQELAKVQEQILTLSTSFPDKFEATDFSAGSFYFSRDKMLIFFQLVLVPIFSQKITSVSLSYHTDNKSPYEAYFQGGWCLSLSIFSDNALHTAFAHFIKQHPNKDFANTFYLFQETGKFAKVIRVKKEFMVDRGLVLDTKLSKDYLSEMTRLDFDYAERGLMLLKERLEESIQRQNDF
jgi:hypothetical protein